MTERERLARIFSIEPLRPVGALVMAAVMGLIPWMWIGSGTLVVWMTAIVVDEQRKIRAALAEVNGWGFPVTGYREWLLAREPAFDLELRRDVAGELIEDSLTAVDATIVVERRSERVVRVIMRRVEVRAGERGTTFLAGDRKRLTEVRDRVLAPLHADVGVAAMRMGEREALAALVMPRSPTDTESAFRDQAKVAPPDLQSLVHVGTSQLAPPREARSLDVRIDRLLYATGQQPTSAKAMALAIGGGIVVGIAIAPVLALVGAAAGASMAAAMRKSDHRNVSRALAKASHWPFPVEGYDDWLLSGRPVCDVEFGSPPNPASLERRLRSIARVADITWLSPTLIRMETQPMFHHAEQGIRPFWGGDPRELQQIARIVLLPLHDAHRIVAVRLGGYLDRRV